MKIIAKKKDFNIIKIRFSFKLNVSKENLIYSTVLSHLLKYSTDHYQTNRELLIKQLDLYNMSYIGLTNISSNNIISYYDFTFIKPSLIEEKHYLENIVSFIRDIFFDHQSFKEEHLNLVKREVYNDCMQGYSIPEVMLYEKLVGLTKENYGITLYSSINLLDDVNLDSINKFYQEFLKKELCVLIVGDYDNKLLSLIKELPFSNTFHFDNIFNYHDVQYTKNQLVINGHYNQSRLSFNLRYEPENLYENYYLTRMFLLILGGLQNSLYMQNVREKLSLVYYVDVDFINSFNLLNITCGYKNGNSEIVYKALVKEIKKMQKGDFDENLINDAYNYLELGYHTVNNTCGLVLSNLFSHNILGHPSIKEKRMVFKTVTKEDIVNFANKLVISDIVYLEGDINGED